MTSQSQSQPVVDGSQSLSQPVVDGPQSQSQPVLSQPPAAKRLRRSQRVKLDGTEISQVADGPLSEPVVVDESQSLPPKSQSQPPSQSLPPPARAQPKKAPSRKNQILALAAEDKENDSLLVDNAGLLAQSN